MVEFTYGKFMPSKQPTKEQWLHKRNGEDTPNYVITSIQNNMWRHHSRETERKPRLVITVCMHKDVGDLWVNENALDAKIPQSEKKNCKYDEYSQRS